MKYFKIRKGQSSRCSYLIAAILVTSPILLTPAQSSLTVYLNEMLTVT